MLAGEFGDYGESDAGGCSTKQRGEGDARALVAGGEEDGVTFSAEGLGFAEGADRGKELA
jgi:hypothetical protein